MKRSLLITNVRTVKVSMRKNKMNTLNDTVAIEVRTIGDSRGYLWKIIIDKTRGIAKIEKVSGLADSRTMNPIAIDGSIHILQPDTKVSDDMQTLTTTIESRFQAA
jgi:hypothetical protein